MPNVMAHGAHQNVSSADLLSIHFSTVGGYTEDLKIGGWALVQWWALVQQWALVQWWALALDNTVVHYF